MCCGSVLRGNSSSPSFVEKQEAQQIMDDNIPPLPVEEHSVDVFPFCELLRIKVITFSSRFKMYKLITMFFAGFVLYVRKLNVSSCVISEHVSNCKI